MRYFKIFASILFFGWILASCDAYSLADLGGEGQPCSGNGTCSAGLTCCAEHICHAACGVDGDEDVDTEPEFESDSDSTDTIDTVDETEADEAEADEAEADEDYQTGCNPSETTCCDADGQPIHEGEACPDDGLSCTNDLCHEGRCEHERDAWSCLIDGVCYAENDTEPRNSCHYCDPVNKPDSWRNFDNGEVCNQFEHCMTQSTCNGGLCAGSVPLNDGTACGENDADQCASGVCVDCFDTAGCDDFTQDDNPCTTLSCLVNVCAELNDDTATCSDGNACSKRDHCSNGQCVPDIIETCSSYGDCDPADGSCDCDEGYTGDRCEQCDEHYFNPYVAFACVPSVPDYDHDGVCYGPDCAIIEYDVCPTVWNPDHDASACEAWSDHSAEYGARRELALSENGEDSTWRRTAEPVELPLVNGILDDSVVGYWKLDNGEARDYSGNGWHGNLVNAPESTEGTFTDQLGSLSFNGVNQYIQTDIPVTTLRGITAFSVMAWLKIDDMTKTAGILGNDDTGAAQFNFRVLYEKLGISFQMGTWQHSSLDSYIPDENEWFHVAVIVSLNTQQWYINGNLIESDHEPFENLAGNDQVPLMSIGRGVVYNEEDYFDGSIDEVLLFNRALSPDEIRAYYDSRAPYGTRNVPGAQDDFDDIRVTETSDQIDGATHEHLIPHEILGPRPHSDTPCPVEYDVTPVEHIPHIADREDLCGVVGYWKLDGNGEDSSGCGNNLVNLGNPFYSRSRFGENNGSLTSSEASFGGLHSPSDTTQELELSKYTLEAWVFPNNTSFYIVNKGYSDVSNLNYGMYRETTTGRFGCQFQNSQGENIYCMSTSLLSNKKWSHVACILSEEGLSSYINGVLDNFCPTTETPITVSTDLAIGQDSNKNYRIDDVLIHSVAKSPEYIYRRAHPNLPTVRFLANTEFASYHGSLNGPFPWMSYALHWNRPDAAQSAPIVTGLYDDNLDEYPTCYGLLSECTGYAGWWRFDEGNGNIAVDSSTNKNNGTLQGDDGLPQWVAGRERTALEFDGIDDYVEVPENDSINTFTQLSIESAIAVEAIGLFAV